VSSAPAQLTRSPSTSPSQPSLFGFGDAGDEVVAELLKAAALGRVRPEERAMNVHRHLPAQVTRAGGGGQ
jgi:hypothetical protein